MSSSLWHRIAGARIGIVPLPLFCALLAILAAYVARGAVPADLTANIAMLTIGGFACAELGKRLPLLNRIGAAAILATFIPSFLVHIHAIPEPARASIVSFTEQSNFLYLFIATVVVGSILGMERRVLISGFVRILTPVLAGSLAGIVVGCAVGVMLGFSLHDAAFRIVLPVMAGGVGEGAIPLSIGYAALSGKPQGDWLAEILPAVMFGSLTAIVLAGGLNLLGRRWPALTGHGALEPDAAAQADIVPDLPTLGAALVLAMALYLLGNLVQEATGFPGPVIMLFLTLLLKLGRVLSPALEQGAYRNYRFFATLTTYPLLFAIGVAKTPWSKLMAAFNPAELLTIFATVLSLTATGFLVGRWAKISPVEAGIIAACRASQGGTGDVAILSASERMHLMPFAQVATRIGGAVTVTLTLIAFANLG